MSRSTERLALIRDTFFWIGVAFATTAIAIVSASNTGIGERLERQTVPVSWILAGIAILALLVAELCNSAVTPAPVTATARANGVDLSESERAKAPEMPGQAIHHHA